MLGKFTRQHKSDGSLDLARADRAALGVARQAARLVGDALKDVVDKRVQDNHGLLGDTSVGVHLLQHLVDVAAVAGGVWLLAALVAGGRLLGCLLGLAWGLS